MNSSAIFNSAFACFSIIIKGKCPYQETLIKVSLNKEKFFS